MAKRLRSYATEYAKILGRAKTIQQMVEDLHAAANELDPPQ